MEQHTHCPETSEIRPFFGAVAFPETRAAHGGVCEVATCSCGATRRTNRNGSHAEFGKWLVPSTDE